MIHTVKGFSVVNKTEVDAFLEFPSFSMIQVGPGDQFSDRNFYHAVLFYSPIALMRMSHKEV